jgi:hypothetical protein
MLNYLVFSHLLNFMSKELEIVTTAKERGDAFPQFRRDYFNYYVLHSFSTC